MCEEFAIFLMQIDNQKWNDEKKQSTKLIDRMISNDIFRTQGKSIPNLMANDD